MTPFETIVDETFEMITCRCGEKFKSTESVGANLKLCQDCWEAHCCHAWWNPREGRSKSVAPWWKRILSVWRKP